MMYLNKFLCETKQGIKLPRSNECDKSLLSHSHLWVCRRATEQALQDEMENFFLLMFWGIKNCLSDDSFVSLTD